MNDIIKPNNWADILLQTLQSHGGVDTIFWYPGGASIPLYNSFAHSDIRHILARHEQWAAFMAQWYNRSTWRLWVVDATSWPGVANTFTAIADAYKDNIAILLISWQVTSSMIGRDAFQELDTQSAFWNITKYFTQIRNVKDIISETMKAIDMALSGRPGPVHIDIPKDIFLTPYISKTISTSYVYEKPQLDILQIYKCIDMLEKATRPVLLIWHWVKLSWAEENLRNLVERLWIPTVETALAKGVLAPDSSHSLGMLGMHWFYQANMAISEADLILNIGSRFDDRIVGNYDDFWKAAKIIHVDVDKRELWKIVDIDMWIHADADKFISALQKVYAWDMLDIKTWRETIKAWKKEKPYMIDSWTFGGKQVLKKISNIAKNLPKDVIYAVDVGQHQMWASQILEIENSQNRLFSGWFGTMWFSLPSSIWAAVANPEKKVICISGDGGVQMNIQELGVLVQKQANTLKDLDIKIIILDNEYLGMVKQWQDLFPENTRSNVDVLSPDFDMLWKAYGIPSYQLDTIDAMDKELWNILSSDGPSLIWCKIAKEENVFPMVPAGKRLDQMVFE